MLRFFLELMAPLAAAGAELGLRLMLTNKLGLTCAKLMLNCYY